MRPKSYKEVNFNPHSLVFLFLSLPSTLSSLSNPLTLSLPLPLSLSLSLSPPSPPLLLSLPSLPPPLSLESYLELNIIGSKK